MRNFCIILFGVVAIFQANAALSMIGDYTNAIEKDGVLLIMAISLLAWYALTTHSLWIFPLVLLKNPGKSRMTTSFGLRFSTALLGFIIAIAEYSHPIITPSTLQVIPLIVISFAMLFLNPTDNTQKN